MVELGDPNGDVVGEGVSGDSGYQTFFGFQLKFCSRIRRLSIFVKLVMLNLANNQVVAGWQIL